jgi:hypothetical protein
MTKRPDDETPEPTGGRAAERLREFIDARFPEGERPEFPVDDSPDEEEADGQAGPADAEAEPGPQPLGDDPRATDEQEGEETSRNGPVNPDP